MAEYRHLLQMSGGNRSTALFLWPNVHVMKRPPAFFPLQGDPRFPALLADPKHNAPLF